MAGCSGEVRHWLPGQHFAVCPSHREYFLRASKAVIDVKKKVDFYLKFGHIPLKEGGVVVVSVAALGNVDSHGCISGEPLKEVFSQSCYMVLLGDQALLSGKPGRFYLCLTIGPTTFLAWLAHSYAAGTLQPRKAWTRVSWLAAFSPKRWAIQCATRMGTSW